MLRLAHGKASALDLELLSALEQALADVAASAARAVIITGSGGIFSAGVDLRRLVDGGPAYLVNFLPALDRTLRRLLFLPKPVVAAVNGHAIAGGCVLACACDRRLAARGPGRVGVTELLVGVPFPAVALETMRLVVPPHRLAEVVYTGRTWPVEDAVAVGLVDEVVEAERLLDRACAVAESLGAIPADSFALTKANLHQPAADVLAVHAARIDAEVARVWASPAARAALGAYVERTLGGRRSPEARRGANHAAS